MIRKKIVDFKALEKAVSFSENFSPMTKEEVDESQLRKYLETLVIHDVLRGVKIAPFENPINMIYPDSELEEAFRRITDSYGEAVFKSTKGDAPVDFVDYMTDRVLADDFSRREGINLTIAYYLIKYGVVC